MMLSTRNNHSTDIWQTKESFSPVRFHRFVSVGSGGGGGDLFGVWAVCHRVILTLMAWDINVSLHDHYIMSINMCNYCTCMHWEAWSICVGSQGTFFSLQRCAGVMWTSTAKFWELITACCLSLKKSLLNHHQHHLCWLYVF